MLRGKNGALIFLRKHGAGVEDQAEVGCVRGLLHFGENNVRRRGIGLVFVAAGPSAAIPRKAKILARAGDAIHFAGSLVVAHAVDLIVVGPERIVLWIE